MYFCPLSHLSSLSPPSPLTPSFPLPLLPLSSLSPITPSFPSPHNNSAYCIAFLSPPSPLPSGGHDMQLCLWDSREPTGPQERVTKAYTRQLVWPLLWSAVFGVDEPVHMSTLRSTFLLSFMNCQPGYRLVKLISQSVGPPVVSPDLSVWLCSLPAGASLPLA